MRLVALADETNCLRSQQHVEHCTGINHVCYRCGMFMKACDCPSLGSLLDY
ncbi:MAG: hypothetical protein LYZ70_07465 [Nitrososphaerales archaeon]|nr:hypothetical protein [Nitrososphaerales archaeon]